MASSDTQTGTHTDPHQPDAHAGHGHGGAAGQVHVHVVPPWLLLSVFAALMVLTVATVGVTYIDFGRTINVWFALGIAFIKAVLVALYFMHLRWDSKFNGLVLIASLFFVCLFIGITLLDTKEYDVNFQPPASTAARPQP